MSNAILDALERSLGETVENVGSGLLAPGDYYRGLMAGRPGERLTGRQYLDLAGSLSPDDDMGALKGYLYEIGTDPLVGLGISAKVGVPTRAALSESMAPIGRAIGKFAADEGGFLDWTKFASSIKDPIRRNLLRSAGPEEYFAKQGIDYADVPARRVEVIGDRLGIPVEWKGPGEGSAYATYNPETKSIGLRRSSLWTSPQKMTSEMNQLGTGDRPFLSTSNPLHIGTHEMLHGLQHREAPSLIDYLRGEGGMMTPERSGWLGRNVGHLAQMNPHEAVAEIGAKKVLTPEAIIKPQVEQAWSEYGGPNLDELRKALGLR